jgi:uncharacterized protein (TIGR03435 family)
MRAAVLWHSAFAATALLVAGIGFGQQAKKPAFGEAASDPGIAPTLQQSLKRLGLELRNQRALVEHVIVEHVEKMPTEN